MVFPVFNIFYFLVLPHPGIPVENRDYAICIAVQQNKKQQTYKQQMHQVRFNFVLYNDCVENAVRSQVCHVTLSFVPNYPSAENACSASTDVCGMLDNAVNSCSNLFGLFPFASNNFISCFITV